MDRKAIGARLRKCRGSRSIETIAEAIGVSPSAISMYENGVRVPKDDIKIKLASYYKKSIQWLFYAD